MGRERRTARRARVSPSAAGASLSARSGTPRTYTCPQKCCPSLAPVSGIRRLYPVSTYYRVHSADESPETVLDPRRPDGWVASDEAYETQPHGVSCCPSIGDLLRYIRHYGLAPQGGDVVLALDAEVCDDDRDEYASRVEVRSYRVLGSAEGLAEAAEHVDAIEDLRHLRGGYLRSRGVAWGTYYDSVDELREDLDISDAAWGWLVRAAEEG